MGGRQLLCAVLLCGCACGRIGYDPLGQQQSGTTDADLTSPNDGGAESIVVGELDPDFAVSGVLLYDYVDDDGLTKDDRATGVVIDAEGRALVSVSGMHRFYVSDDQFDMAAISMRVMPDGSLDPSYQFGALAEPGVTVNVTSRWSHANAIVQDDRSITLCGYRELGGTDSPTMHRHQKVGGQPDGPFGASGTATVSVSGEAQAWDMTIDPTDGNYVLAGSVSGNSMFVIKISSVDGAPVSSFAGAGIVAYDVAGDDHAAAVVVDGQGRIYIGGHQGPNELNHDVTVWRYLPDGSADPSFSGDGIFRYDGGGNDQAWGLALNRDDDLIVVGLTGPPAAPDMLVLRVDQATGELDPGFGTGGVFTYDSGAGPSVDFANAVVVGPDNGLLVAGSSSLDATDQAMAIWKLSAGGNLDQSFGSEIPGVFLSTNANGGNADEAYDLAYDPTGKVVIVGESKHSGGFSAAAVWKLQ